MSTPPFDLTRVPESLKQLDRWLCWRYEMREGKETKIPYNPVTHERASTTCRTDVAELNLAVGAASDLSRSYSGIGFVFVPEDGLSGVDLDDCINAEGVLEPWAQVIVDGLASYTEISPSGRGVKVFLKGSLEGKERRRTGNIEMYSAGRYFTVTGNHLPGTPLTVESRQSELDALHAHTFAPSPPTPASLPRAGGDLTDDQIIELAGKAKNGAKFKKLWGGDTTGYRHDENDGHSEADLALCSILAFYTGADADRIDRLFRQSGLYREKWLLRQDYREATIEKALASKTEFYTSGGASNEGEDDDDPTNMADRIVHLAIQAGVVLFHTADANPVAYATIPCKDHEETWSLGSRKFKLWLQQLMYKEYKKSANDTALTTAIRTLEARAVFEGETHAIYLRIGSLTTGGEMTIYLDLGDDRWRVVEVTAKGWRVLDKSPVKFRRTMTSSPLPVPKRGGSIERLRRFVNAPDDYTWRLLVGFAISTFHPTGGYPVLVLNGEAGSAKSTTSRVLRALCDPSTLPLRQKPKSNHDLCVAAGASWVLAFDNLSFITEEFSDTLCTISTGGGMGARKLYTDDDEHVVNYTRPVILTGIDELVVRDDLLSRSIRASLPRIAKASKRTERQFWEAFGREHPYILGAMLDGVVSALANLPRVEAEITEKERMADFCVWATAAEAGLGLKGGSIMTAYRQMLSESAEITLESSLIAPALLEVIGTWGWSGTATQLFNELKRHAGIVGDVVPQGWPKRPNQVMGHVVRIAVPLRARGFEAWRDRCNESERTRLIHIRPAGSSGASGSSGAVSPGTGEDHTDPSGPSDVVRTVAPDDAASPIQSLDGTPSDAPDAPDDHTPSDANAGASGGPAPDAPDGADDVDAPRRPPFGHAEDYDDGPDAMPL